MQKADLLNEVEGPEDVLFQQLQESIRVTPRSELTPFNPDGDNLRLVDKNRAVA